MRRLSFILPFLFLARLAAAQTEDLGSWLTFSVNKKLTDKIEFNLDQELRLRHNFTDINLLYTNIGFSFKPAKWLKISPTYRFIDKHKDDGTWGIRHRAFIDFAFKVKPGKFTLGYRARFQSEWRGSGYDHEYGNVPEIYVRNLFKIGYKATEKISPYIGTELRFQVQNPRIPYHNGFDRARFFAGADYEVNSNNSFGLYFLVQKEYNVIDPETLYIIGIEYALNL
jgi:hypothetical protein